MKHIKKFTESKFIGEQEYTYHCKENDNVITVCYLDGEPDELHISNKMDDSYYIISISDLNAALTSAEIQLTK